MYSIQEWLSAVAAGLFALHVLQKLFFPYFWKDVTFLWKIITYGIKLELCKLTSKVVTVVDTFVEQAQRIPDKAFLIYEGVVHTYRDIDERSNRVANVFLKQGTLKKGDCVVLLMNNEPDFVSVWFGLTKVGCTVAFLNTNIKSKSLLHCFNCCGAKTLVVGAGNNLSYIYVYPIVLFSLLDYYDPAAMTILPKETTTWVSIVHKCINTGALGRCQRWLDNN